jgi:hypothetical protein
METLFRRVSRSMFRPCETRLRHGVAKWCPIDTRCDTLALRVFSASGRCSCVCSSTCLRHIPRARAFRGCRKVGCREVAPCVRRNVLRVPHSTRAFTCNALANTVYSLHEQPASPTQPNMHPQRRWRPRRYTCSPRQDAVSACFMTRVFICRWSLCQLCYGGTNSQGFCAIEQDWCFPRPDAVSACLGATLCASPRARTMEVAQSPVSCARMDVRVAAMAARLFSRGTCGS